MEDEGRCTPAPDDAPAPDDTPNDLASFTPHAPIRNMPTPPPPDPDRERFVNAVFDRAESWAEAQIARDFALEARLERELEASTPAPASPEDPDEAIINLTDTGNMRRLVRRYGENMRYCAPWASWMLWDGVRWVRDVYGVVTRAAIKTALAIRKEAHEVTADPGAGATAGDDKDAAKERKAIVAWSLKSESAPRVNAMVELAKSHRRVGVLPQAFDRDPLRINFPNGTYCLRIGGLLAHDRRFMLTKLAGAAYDPCERAPRWEQFLSEIMCGNAELVEFLQRAAGYSLLGDTSEHVLFVLHGSGANGKSVFLETLRHVLGDYAGATPFETFLENNTPRGAGTPNPSLAALAGLRFVVASEVNEGRRLDEAAVKSITGGDKIKCRDLYEKEFSYTPAFKLWLACNHKPSIKGTDEGIWRRLRLIPFEARFDGIAHPKDPKLLEKLKDEAPGILAWLIRGALAWRKQGLNPPKAVLAATGDYRAESDALGTFFEECCEAHPNDTNFRIRASALFEAYQKWSKAREERPLSATAFGLRVKERGFQVDPGTSHRRWYLGIALRSVASVSDFG